VSGIEKPQYRVTPPSWDRYVRQVDAEWRSLLDADARNELALQRFLEAHPCLLPYTVAYTPSGTPDYGHHGTIHSGVFAQPRLPGSKTLRPDFMRITRDSQWTYVTLFELKWAGMQLFRGGARFRDAFDAAREQLNGYAAALESDGWREFRDLYRLPSYVDHRDLHMRLVLLAGRRSEVYQHPERRDRRRRESLVVRSLDSLVPAAEARDEMNLALRRGQIMAAGVQPTMRFGPGNAGALAIVRGVAAAIGAQPAMPPRRKQFLLERLPYWQSFDRRPGLRISQANYWE
jgi:hypothetical protein